MHYKGMRSDVNRSSGPAQKRDATSFRMDSMAKAVRHQLGTARDIHPSIQLLDLLADGVAAESQAERRLLFAVAVREASPSRFCRRLKAQGNDATPIPANTSVDGSGAASPIFGPT